MSSPAYDDAADQSISASPPPLLDHESEEVRRLHDQVAEAAEVLIGDARKPADQDAEPYVGNDSFDLVLATRRVIESEASRSGLWSLALPPALIPPLPDDDDDSVGLIAMTKLGFAIGLAAGVAYVVTSMVQLPGSGPTMARDTTAVLSQFTQISAAQAGVQKNDIASVPATAILAAAQANIENATHADVESAGMPTAPAVAAEPATPVALAPPPVAAIAPPAAADVTPPPAVTEVTPPPAPPSPPHATSSLARDEVAALMKRGRDLLAVGDIASARLILARLADNGEADASLLLAGTFDPVQLARLHVFGVVPDAEKARAWYAKAAEQGSPEAGRHLQQSASR